jgi:ribosomal silencing factor RsfS
VVLVTIKTHVHAKAMIQALDHAFFVMNLGDDSPDFYAHPKISGEAESGWIVIDFNSIVFHVLTEDVRQYYMLDEVYAKQGVIYYN